VSRCPANVVGVAPEPVTVTAPPLRGPRLLGQRWCDVTFLHWAVDPAAVAGLLPPGVRPDVLDGRTYVGLVPFRMVDVRVARVPLRSFLETNVRLYSVDETGRRGVVFLSLDASSAAVVAAARAVLGLPYRWARMGFAADGDLRRYTTGARSDLVVRVGGPAPDGTLERFLTARWGLHLARAGRTWYLPNAHPPWPLRTAELVALDDGLVAAAGPGDLPARRPDHVLFSDGVAAAFGPPVLATTPRPAPG
jgi:uncharacterized protein